MIQGQVLVFDVEGQRYAIPLAQAREVVRAVATVMLPGAPSVIEGVINVRGSSVPVFDLRRRFGLPARAVSINDQMILASTGAREVALRVDRALEILDLPPGEVDVASTVTRGVEHIAGIFRQPDGMILIHDLSTFLSQAEAEGLTDALALRERA